MIIIQPRPLLCFVLLVTKSCLIFYNPMDCSLLCPWDFLGNNTGVGCHILLQGIFLTQGSHQHPLHLQADSLTLSHLGSPKGQTYSVTFQIASILNFSAEPSYCLQTDFLDLGCQVTINMYWKFHP